MKKKLTTLGVFAGILCLSALVYFNPFQQKHPENFIELTDNLMAQIDAELDTTRLLKKEYIMQISALSASFVPYHMSENEQEFYSPGRGLLLQECVKRNLPKDTYDKIFQKTNFSHALLKNANLENAYLHGVRAVEANFENANLKKAIVTKANLSKANLSGADLEGGNFDKTIMKKAQFRGGNLKEVQFNNTYLVEADFTDTQIKGTSFETATTNGAIFDDRLVQAN